MTRITQRAAIPALMRRAQSWLWAGLLWSVSLNCVAAGALLLGGATASDVSEAIGVAHLSAYTKLVEEDSWMPMTKAYLLKQVDPSADMYRLFFDEHIKLQYPPSSLLVLDALPGMHTLQTQPLDSEAQVLAVQRWMTWPSRLLCLAVVLLSAWLVESGLAQLSAAGSAPSAPSTKGRAGRVACSLLLGSLFYPLLRGYELGQIQVLIDALCALALWCMLRGRAAASGVALGLCCLVKPQYGVVLLWAALRRERRFAGGFAAACALGLAVSLWRFGVHDHVRYLAVLQVIGRQGEVFWPNQSLNGLLNRFLGNGDAITFTEDAFAPYLASVHVATLCSLLVLIVLALWPKPHALERFGDRRYSDALALALLLAAATLGSPVAWEHHYGAFLPIFALALPGLAHSEPCGRWTPLLLAIAYASVANALLRPELVLWNRWLGLAASHIYFGGLLLFVLLCAAGRGRYGAQRSAEYALAS